MQKLTKDRIVLIIPYYGSMPPYFDLWKIQQRRIMKSLFL